MGCCNSIPKELLDSDVPFYELNIHAKIWSRESHGLFDYYNQSFKEFSADKNGNFFLHGADSQLYCLLPSVKPDDSNSTNLLSFAYKKGRYWVYHCRDFTTRESLKQPSDQPWISLKHINPKSHSSRYDPKYGYRLKQGDIIKFGRVRFRISRISSEKNSTKENREVQTENNQIIKSDESDNDDSMYFEKQLREEEINNINLSGVEIDSGGHNDVHYDNKSESRKIRDTCRVCLSLEDDPDDPLITICKCSGTMGLIHLECIKGWLDSKLHKKFVPHTFSYNWKNLRCELCKERLKDRYYIQGKPVHLLNYKRPQEGKYITLESFTNTPHKTIHVINLQENLEGYSEEMSFLIGRENNVNIRITDISVSRNHALLTYKDGEFYVQDTQSKFGTLILMQSPFPIPYTDQWDLTLQIGKNLINISPKILPKGICEKSNFAEIPLPNNKIYDAYSALYPKVMNKKFGIPINTPKPVVKPIVGFQLRSQRIKSRNTPLVNNLTPSNMNEEKKYIQNIHDIRSELRKFNHSKDSTALFPTYRANDTEHVMTIERNQDNSPLRDDRIRTTLSHDTQTISTKKILRTSSKADSTKSRY
ncbi:unnamed protein product [Moneuplotes crassus]|uniref:Uncharacterized protein n=1 Tax=Euplotes crassus TaxID=5936 RepID=A0AAD2D871_EUPCR|nr:unnamed protein product [Moneuplotes crassus]